MFNFMSKVPPPKEKQFTFEQTKKSKLLQRKAKCHKEKQQKLSTPTLIQVYVGDAMKVEIWRSISRELNHVAVKVLWRSVCLPDIQDYF